MQDRFNFRIPQFNEDGTFDLRGQYLNIAGGTDFAQALAQLTTELMNAGELDKQKVKEILE